MPDELKLESCPNPRCKSTNLYLHELDGGPGIGVDGYYVSCSRCHMSGPFGREEDAIAAWNALPREPKIITYDGTDSTLPDEERVFLINAQSTGRLSRDWKRPCWWVDADHDFRPLKIGDQYIELPWEGGV